MNILREIIAARYKSINILAERKREMSEKRPVEKLLHGRCSNKTICHKRKIELREFTAWRCKNKYATSRVYCAQKYADRKVVSIVKIRRTFWSFRRIKRSGEEEREKRISVRIISRRYNFWEERARFVASMLISFSRIYDWFCFPFTTHKCVIRVACKWFSLDKDTRCETHKRI